MLNAIEIRAAELLSEMTPEARAMAVIKRATPVSDLDGVMRFVPISEEILAHCETLLLAM